MDWDSLYVVLIEATGWSWEHVDEEVTLPMVAAFAKHWDVVPPLSVSIAGIAAAIGVRREDPKSEPNMEELAAALGGVGRKPEWLTRTE